MKKNILFSTTRQFNVGDEFILFGVLNVFSELFGEENYNPIIFNRNPDVRPAIHWKNPLRSKKITHCDTRLKNYLRILFHMDFYDNSFRDDSDWQKIDLIVFAGTPEWQSLRTKILYQKAYEWNIPCVFIGIGIGDGASEKWITETEDRILSRTKYIFVRDADADRLLKRYGSKMIACPALVCSRKERVVRKVNRVGLIYSSSRVSRMNNISLDTEKYIKKLFCILREKYDTVFICHYVEELDYIDEDFPGSDYCYAYDAQRYFDIYNQCDIVIGCRVHGIGIAASLGIPGVAIMHSARSSTVEQFGATTIVPGENSLEEDLQKIETIMDHIEEYSRNVVKNKQEVFRKYQEELASVSELF